METATALPEWMIGMASGERAFIMHLHRPRFLAEVVRPTGNTLKVSEWYDPMPDVARLGPLMRRLGDFWRVEFQRLASRRVPVPPTATQPPSPEPPLLIRRYGDYEVWFCGTRGDGGCYFATRRDLRSPDYGNLEALYDDIAAQRVSLSQRD